MHYKTPWLRVNHLTFSVRADDSAEVVSSYLKMAADGAALSLLMASA